ncbi:ABC transporter permease [Thermodesulfobacteriota bacterium]
MRLFRLVENEVFKILFKRRLSIIFCILVALISAFSYGQGLRLERTKDRLSKRIGASATEEWRKLAEQRLIEMRNRLESPYINDDHRSKTIVRIEQLKYNLDNNINPIDISSAKFTSKFMEQAIFLLLPLLIIMLASDIVSGESTAGTIKLLLARAVPRWKILLSKYLALIMMEIIVILFSFIISIVVSGLSFKYGGWTAPVATGFTLIGDKLDTSGVMNVPQYEYTLMVYSLAFYVAMVVGTISFMISVLVRSTAVSIGIMMSTLIGGTFLGYFLSDWKITRYMFMVNLRLPDYLSGTFQPIAGMNMFFSVSVLAVWAFLALIVSFVYFTREDILV